MRNLGLPSVICTVCWAWAFFSNPPSAFARSRIVFQIGRQDHSFAEFVPNWPRQKPVLYDVATSRSATDWPAYQPGTFDPANYYVASAKPPQPSSPVPFEIRFPFSSRPKGTYDLRVDLIFLQPHPVIPRYQVEINGHTGVFTLHPQPDLSLWWPSGVLQPLFSGYYTLSFPVSPTMLRQNIIRLLCIDGFGVYYGDIELTQHEENPGSPSVVAAAVEPTIFYQHAGNGLEEIAKVWIRTTQKIE